MVWMNERPLERSRRYLLKHTSQLVSAEITSIRFRIDVNTLAEERAETLEMNAIGTGGNRDRPAAVLRCLSSGIVLPGQLYPDRSGNERRRLAAGMIVQAAIAKRSSVRTVR